MTRALIFILGLLLSSCADQRIDRSLMLEPEKPWTEQDDAQMGIATTRFAYQDIELNADNPGVLYTVSDDLRATLRDLDTGHYAEFNIANHSISYNGVELTTNASLIKADTESRTLWYRGILADGATPVYFIYTEL